MPQSLCLNAALPLTLPSSSTTSSNVTGWVLPTSVRSPVTLSRPSPARETCGRAELDGLPLEHLLVDRLLDVRAVVVVERLDPARALEHPQRRAVGREHDARLRPRGRACPPRSATSISRSCPAFDAAPWRVVFTVRRPLSGPSCASPVDRHALAAYIQLSPDRSDKETSHMAIDLDQPVLDDQVARRELRRHHRPRAHRARAWRGDPCWRRRATTPSRREIKVKMGAMSMTFTGTVSVAEKDEAEHRALLRREVAREGRPGARQRGRGVQAQRQRRQHPHPRADHGQGGVDGRGSGGGRARRADHRLHRQAPRHLRSTPMATITMKQVRPGEVPKRRRHRAAGGPGRPVLQRQWAERLRVRGVRQRARHLDAPRADDVQGARALRGVQDDQRGRERRPAGKSAPQQIPRPAVGRAQRVRASWRSITLPSSLTTAPSPVTFT